MDTSFHAPHIDYGQVNNFHPLENGKVLAGGRFVLAGIPDTLCWAILLPNGALDTTFNNRMSFQEHYPYETAIPLVNSFFPVDADKMIITGIFDEINGGGPFGGIAMVDTAGHLLTNYFSGAGCGVYYNPVLESGIAFILGITPSPEGNYYIYGAYKGYNDGSTNDALQGFVSRLYGLNVGIQEQAAKTLQLLSIFPNPSTGATELNANEPLAHAELYIHDGSGRLVWQVEWPAGAEQYTLPTGALAPGVYVVRVASASRASRTSAASATAATTATTPGHQGSGAETLMEQYTGRLVVMP